MFSATLCKLLLNLRPHFAPLWFSWKSRGMCPVQRGKCTWKRPLFQAMLNGLCEKGFKTKCSRKLVQFWALSSWEGSACSRLKCWDCNLCSFALLQQMFPCACGFPVLWVLKNPLQAPYFWNSEDKKSPQTLILGQSWMCSPLKLTGDNYIN